MEVCSVKDCSKKGVTRGLCSTHYSRWRIHGDPYYCEREYHGMTGTKIYRVYVSMKERCQPNYAKAHRYFDRGITVCEAWDKSFLTFYKDMGDIPFKEAELDRRDNDGNYTPENCRWVTHQENGFNRSDVKGAFYEKTRKKWIAQIRYDGEHIYLGTFETEELATVAYRHIAKRLGRGVPLTSGEYK